MKILTLRTDSPEAELGIYEDHSLQHQITWMAHVKLTKTLHNKIKKELVYANLSLEELEGLVFYEGPGSFTGLRIGASVVNALAYSLEIPVVGVSGKDWTTKGIKKLLTGKGQKIALPNYGSPAKTTISRK